MSTAIILLLLIASGCGALIIACVMAGGQKGDGDKFKTYRFRGKGADNIEMQGIHKAEHKILGNWDDMMYQNLYYRPDGTYTVTVHINGGRKEFNHELTQDDVRKGYPGLARKAGFSRTVLV